jgi:hypothetical protein
VTETNIEQGTWWSILPAPDGGGTYRPVPLADLPALPSRLADSLDWLTGLHAVDDEYARITRTDQAARPFTPDAHSWLISQGVPEDLIPTDLAHALTHPETLSGIRSATYSTLDLADRVTPLAADAGGGWLIHVLTDQQAVLNWLLHFTADGTVTTIATPAAIGYTWSHDADEPYPVPDRALTAADLTALEATRCEGSFTKFVARLWLDNETWWAQHGETTPYDEVRTYLSALT